MSNITFGEEAHLSSWWNRITDGSQPLEIS